MFLLDLVTTILGYIILSCSYLGFGGLVLRLWAIDFAPAEKPFSLIWLGWAITLLLLQILNLFVPIAAYLSIFLLVLGWISFFVWLAGRRSASGTFLLPRIYPVLLGAAALWLAALSMRSPENYDSGFYHFNSIRWLNESPIVLGLGNLFNRLAFNQSFFTIATKFSWTGPFAGF
jgi:hypothetical protein